MFHFSKPQITLFPEAIAGTIACVDPTLRVWCEGTSWQGKLYSASQALSQALPRPGQLCRVIGRQGITLLVQLEFEPLP
ncbi:MAG: hypothetical protein AAGG51_08155 [Cyanobacteria bacterium P01_G01_bin.54]